MFIGHYALAFGSRKLGRSPSLAVMFIAVQFLDLLWPILVLAGVETFEIEVGNTALTPLNFTSYPYSHSLLMSFLWANLFAIVYVGFTKNKRGAFLLGCLVVSHWVLDFITHRPDLQLSPFNDMRVGLGLWNEPIPESILEVGLFLTGAYIYIKSTVIKRKIAFWSLIIVFLAIHFMNIFGPPPPSVNAVAWTANLMWLFVLWAWWIEKK
ncbi:MAG TPA: metal-dependent hydrolase [Ferruginibacter sp.]|nr:metal-dependent hydrolase [Ferruginibacter sp.]